MKNALADPEYVIEEAPFNGEIMEAMLKVSRAEVPDMPDRIVAATGLHFGVPVISRDGRIRSSSVKTIWQAGGPCFSAARMEIGNTDNGRRPWADLCVGGCIGSLT